jgi:hypothetical protein
MSFYYDDGQPDDENDGGFREVVAVIVAMLQVLAVPFAILFGISLFIGLIIWLFTVHSGLGFAALGLLGLVLVGRVFWELLHPPKLKL